MFLSHLGISIIFFSVYFILNVDVFVISSLFAVTLTLTVILFQPLFVMLSINARLNLLNAKLVEQFQLAQTETKFKVTLVSNRKVQEKIFNTAYLVYDQVYGIMELQKTAYGLLVSIKRK